MSKFVADKEALERPAKYADSIISLTQDEFIHLTSAIVMQFGTTLSEPELNKYPVTW